MNENNSDSLFAEPLQSIPDFVFDETVASVFPDMIKRSVPGYSAVISMTGLLAARYSKPGTRLYDLGCSLGATSLSMASSAQAGCEIIAVDNSQVMIDRFNALLDAREMATPVLTHCDDIENIRIDQASVVALNYTLQFVPLGKRDRLLNSIAAGIIDGGVLILSEKIAFDNAEVSSLFADLHREFKRANGYSELEISQKRQAIEDVLIPEALAEHHERLRKVGFSRTEVWFQCLNFVSLLAFK